MALDAKRIDKSIRKVRKLLKKDSQLLNPDEVHDLRTRSRRVQAAIQAGDLDSKNNESKLLRKLKRVRRKAGAVRDMDVLTSHLLSVKVDGEQDCMIQLAEHLGRERYREAEKLRKAIARYGTTLRRRLARTEKRFEKMLGDRGSVNQRQGLEKSAAGTALELSAELAVPANLNRTNFHPYRIKVKKLRYVLQSAQDNKNQSFVEALGETKDAIGEWHDWEELIAIASKVLDHRPQCELMAELKKGSNQKFEAAMAASTRLRREFLRQHQQTKGARDGHKRGTSEPALRAVAAIAS